MFGVQGTAYIRLKNICDKIEEDHYGEDDGFDIDELSKDIGSVMGRLRKEKICVATPPDQPE